MKVGSIGGVAFNVDSKNASILRDYQRSVSANYAVHNLIGQTGVMEFTGVNPTEVSFVLKLSAFLGINPGQQLQKIEEMAKNGQKVTLTIGTSVIGEKWAILSVASKAEFYDREGDVTSYEVTVSLKECVTPKINTDTSGYYLEASTTGWQKKNGSWYYYLNGVMHSLSDTVTS